MLTPQLVYKEGIPPDYFFIKMSQSRTTPITQHFGDHGYSPIRENVQAIQLNKDADEDYASDDCVCAKDTCDECNPGEGGRISRPFNVFKDDVKNNQLVHCHDTIQACWNAWNLACKFEDPNQASYFLDLLTLTQQYQKRLLALKKKQI